MANTVGGTVVWNLDVDNSKFTSGLNKAKSEIKGFESNLKSAEKGSYAFAGALTAIATATAGIVTFGVKSAASLESARQGFVALLGSAELADKTMSRIKEEASRTPFELTGLTTGTQALTAITKDGNKAIDILLDVGKAVAISGKGQAELDRVVYNLQQISATGKVTAMDIRQFQSAIPIFNDIIATTGLTTEELQDADNAAELLFDAFKKAGETGGISAEGFTAQAGTFNQLWSNLIDTITIGASDFVKISGIFDTVKNALSGIITTLKGFTTPESINRFLTFLKDNGPIIAGVILGGLTPALIAMGSAVIVAMAPLLPFIAVGALLGFIVKRIVDNLGGWDKAWGAVQEIMAKVQPVFDALGAVFQGVILPLLQDIWKQITTELVPALQELWKTIGPILIPILKTLGIIFATIVVAAIIGVLTALDGLIRIFTLVVKWIDDGVKKIVGFFTWLYNELVGHSIIPDLINEIVAWFKSLPDMISRGLSNLWSALVTPFKNAFNEIKRMSGEVWDKLQKLNPFHRESPSLVDNVKAGIGIIKDEYAKLGNISMNSPVFDYGGAGITPQNSMTNNSSTINQDINISIGKINDEQDISALGRELGYRASLLGV